MTKNQLARELKEVRELKSRRNQIEEELIEIEKRLDDLGYSWDKFAEEYRSKLGVTPDIKNSVITSKAQKTRVQLMEYLIKHKHTSENPISYKVLSDKFGMSELRNSLGVGYGLKPTSKYSPLYSGLKLNATFTGRGFGKRSHITELYIEDMEKAKIYVNLIKKLMELPIKRYKIKRIS